MRATNTPGQPPTHNGLLGHGAFNAGELGEADQTRGWPGRAGMRQAQSRMTLMAVVENPEAIARYRAHTGQTSVHPRA